MRRARYVAGTSVPPLPDRVRLHFGLNDDAAVGSRRIEIGSGWRPTPGYIHIDPSRTATHVEFFARADRLPFTDRWAQKILAIHILEHVEPSRLAATLREWYRVLRPGGVVEIHVPDSDVLMQALLDAPLDKRWALTAALLGMYGRPEITGPEQIRSRADHQILFNAELLRNALSKEGFKNVVDRSSSATDAHNEGWRPLLPRISLVMTAERGEV